MSIIRGLPDDLVNAARDILVEGHDDDSAAHELVLHADNDSRLHHTSHQPIIKNLARKAKKGTYDPEKAKKLWGYHADRAAQSYHKAHGSPGTKWHEMFPKHVRAKAAEHWEKAHRHELHEEGVATSKTKQGQKDVQEQLQPKQGSFEKNFKQRIRERVETIGGLTLLEVSNEPPNIQRLQLTQEEPLYKKRLKESENYEAETKKRREVKEASEDLGKTEDPASRHTSVDGTYEEADRSDSITEAKETRKDKVKRILKKKKRPIEEANDDNYINKSPTPKDDTVNNSDKTLTGQPRDKVSLTPSMGLGLDRSGQVKSNFQ